MSKDETINTINEATKALLERTQSPSLDEPTEIWAHLDAMGEIIEIQNMSKDDLKGKRILMVGLSPQVMTAASMAGLPAAVLAAKVAQEMEDERESRLVMHLKSYTPEPMPEVRIEKKDRFSFLDGLYGRGKGRAKSQGYAQHFKR